MKYTIIIIILILSLWGNGDADNNGRVSSSDLHRVFIHVQGTRPLSPLEWLRADTNKDLRVDERDMQMILDKVLRR